MAETEQAMQALRQGLKLEQDGLAFYTRAAGELAPGPTRDALLSLADEERVHEAMIARQMQALAEDGAYAALPGLDAADVGWTESVFPEESRRVLGRLGRVVSEEDALQMGMEVEVNSYDHYRAAADATEDPAGREMYRWLATAERAHFDQLMSIYRGLNQQANWS